MLWVEMNSFKKTVIQWQKYDEQQTIKLENFLKEHKRARKYFE